MNNWKYGDILKANRKVARSVHPETRMMFIADNHDSKTDSFAALTLRDGRPIGPSADFPLGENWARNAWERVDE